MKIWQYVLVFLVMGQFVFSYIANAGDWPDAGEWLMENEDYYYRPPSEDCDCRVWHSLHFQDIPAGYSKAIFDGWYGGGYSLDQLNILSVNGAPGCYPVPVDFNPNNKVDIVANAFIVMSDRGCGVIDMCWIEIYCVDDVDLSTDAGKTYLSSVVGHEMGHSIGLDHGSGGVMLEDDAVTTPFDLNHFGLVGKIYRPQLHDICVDRINPAYFGDVQCEFENWGTRLVINTIREDNVNRVIVKYTGDANKTYEEYLVKGEIELNSPDGGEYSFNDFDSDNVDRYLLEVINEQGEVDNILFVIPGSTNWYDDYSEDAIEEMLNYNINQINNKKWLDIATGEISVKSIDTTFYPECEYLVIAHDNFVEEIAPICDYWWTKGIEVGLVRCSGLVLGETFGDDSSHSEYVEKIRSFIINTNARKPLTGVWLVGETLHPKWYPADFSERDYWDLVPTDLEKGDFIFSEIDGDGLIDFPVGRLPACASREVIFYVNKELRYHYETVGGKKDPDRYSNVQVHCVPDVLASGTTHDWNEGQNSTVLVSQNVLNEFESTVGINAIGFFSNELISWTTRSQVEYYDDIKDRIFNDLVDGRHVIFGFSQHNSYSQQYGVVGKSDWLTFGTCLPGRSCVRPCETFWFTPLCYSNLPGQNMRMDENEPPWLNTTGVSIFELFHSYGLLYFGSRGITYTSIGNEVGLKMAQEIFSIDENIGHAKSVGEIWKNVHNEIRLSSATYPNGLSDFGIFGDPMLFVRGVYGEATPTEMIAPVEFSCEQFPNPSNGRIQFVLSGLGKAGGEILIYDVRGRLVKSFYIPPCDGVVKVLWEGDNSEGQTIASGTYFAVAKGNGKEIKKKIAYVK